MDNSRFSICLKQLLIVTPLCQLEAYMIEKDYINFDKPAEKISYRHL